MIDTVAYNQALDAVDIVDQTRLPTEHVILTCHTPEQMAHAIRTLQVRGAPAIGVAAAFGVWLGLKNWDGDDAKLSGRLDELVDMLAATRPTAVNLFWALERVQSVIRAALDAAEPRDRRKAALDAALKEAEAVLAEDIEMCRAIGREGAACLKDGETWLTHCNAGALATGGYGTALGVFRAAQEQGKKFRVFVDETRPLLQGSRLTAWELLQEGIDATLICDNMAASLMAAGRIQGVVVGADRITAEGFVANKIGTYGVAVLARYHGIPFYVAAPDSTFDLKLGHGLEIVIEERDPGEVREIRGVPTAPAEMPVCNPAFDVTPPELVTAIFTNRGTLRPPYRDSIAKTIGGEA